MITVKLDEDTYTTLKHLEGVDDAPFTAAQNRSASLLQYLAAAGYVESSGPGRIRITRLGREALREHRQEA
jgi:DNA-binding PadR family transcriptional regulator